MQATSNEQLLIAAGWVLWQGTWLDPITSEPCDQAEAIAIEQEREAEDFEAWLLRGKDDE